MSIITHVTPNDEVLLATEPRISFRLGDCVERLKDVENDSVRVIYMDPPFNSARDYVLSADVSTGFKDKWKDDVYAQLITKVVDMCYLKLAKNGTLYFHISADCMFVPETILRAKFKFVQPIFWKKCRSKNNVTSKLGATIDILFKCTKQKHALFHVVTQPKDATYLAQSFKNKDSVGNYSLGHLVTEPTKRGHMYMFTIDGREFNPPTGWRIKQEDLEVLRTQNRLHVPKGEKAKLYKKIYLHENPGKPCTDLWDDIHSIGQGSESRSYPTAKPQKLLERVIAISSDVGDLVLDPMCGSGTTGAAARALGRRCILIDTNKDLVKILTARFAAPSRIEAKEENSKSNED